VAPTRPDRSPDLPRLSPRASLQKRDDEEAEKKKQSQARLAERAALFGGVKK
jgi:hypothetical protein